MGLDWVIRPQPDDVEQHEYNTVHRAKHLEETFLPESVISDAYRDMTPWQMENYAEALMTELERTQQVSDEDESIVNEAIRWLQYWANQEQSLYASW